MLSGGHSPPQPAQAGVGQPARASFEAEAAHAEPESGDADSGQAEDADAGSHREGHGLSSEEEVVEGPNGEGPEVELRENVDGGSIEEVGHSISGTQPTTAELMMLVTNLTAVVSAMKDEVESLKTKEARTSYSEYHHAPTPAMPPSPISVVSVADVATLLKSTTTATTEGRWMVSEADSLPFMMGSKARALADYNTMITVREVIESTPTTKDETKAYLAHVDPSTLLVSFTDVVTHHEFIDLRRWLGKQLAVIANLEKDAKSGTKAADRKMNAALEVTYSSGEPRERLAKIKRTALDYNRGGRTMPTLKFFELIDGEFGKETAFERDHEIKAKLSDISITKHPPSAIISLAASLYAQHYASIAEENARASMVNRGVQSLVSEKISSGAKEYAWVRPFKSKLLDADFQSKPLDHWTAQFKLFEATAEFTEGQRIAQGASRVTKRGTVPSWGRSTSINDDNEGDEEPHDSIKVAAIHELQSTVEALQSQIAAIGGTRISWRSAEWVTLNGVAGYPAPGDSMRKPIMVGAIWRTAGVPIPADCPREPSALVGFLCPCNHARKIPENMWFFHPDSEQAKNGENAKPPVGVKNFGWMHMLGKCSYAYAKGHELGRANSTNVRLLDPLPTGSNDCIGA